MTITLKGERHAQVLTGSNSDTVLLAFDLPAASVLQEVSASIHLVGVNAAIEREQACMYAVAAYLIELEDPDTNADYEDIWDRFVPKYTDIDVIDLDTIGTDTTPFWEPGEANFDEIFDMGDMPTKLFMRRKMLTFASPGNGGIRFQPAETPFEPQWMAADTFSIKINKSVRVRAPSVFIVSIGNPALDDTANTRFHLGEADWGQIQYVEMTLERALVDQLGLIEAGAETPWEESSDLLRRHLAPDVFEATAGAFIAMPFNIFAQLQFSHTVPGTMDFSVVDLTP